VKGAFATAAALAALCVVVVGQQPPGAAVFTAQQAAAGRIDYAKQCASCHMPDLSGNIEIPPLAGKAFIDTWGARTTKDFFDYLSAAMPYGAPSLSVESYLAITAYIFQSNGAVAGSDALSASTAAPIGAVTASRKNPSE
jgi:mono/diheme cytochrome c family protein